MQADGLVVDASVAVKWYITETNSAGALRLRDGALRLHAPDFLPVEVSNVIWRRTGRGDITAAEATIIVARLRASMPINLYRSTDLLPAALEIALRYQRTVYDALYLALARELGCPLITADERLVNRLQGTALGPFLMTLGRP